MPFAFVDIYAFVPLQLKSRRTRAIIRTGCIDAFLVARCPFDALVDVYTGIVLESISRLALATITARHVGAFVALADTSRAFVDVDASRIHHPESFLTFALVRARFIDADMIAAVLSLAFVDVMTLGIIDPALLKTFLARAHRGTVHRDANLFAAAVALVLTRIGRSTGSVSRYVTWQAFAAKGSQGVDACRIITITVVVCAFVDIDTGSLVLGQLVAGQTGAEVAANGVVANVGTLAVPLLTLVDVQAGGLIGMQVMSLVTGARVAAQQVYAFVGAIVTIGQTLVHVHALFLIVRHQDIASGTLATITTLGVYARVRAARFNVVLKLLAFVDVLAGSEITFQAEAERARATDVRDCNFVGIFFLMTIMRTIAIVALATVYQNASSIISLQNIFRWTQTLEGTYEIHARMRTSRVLALAFVDIVAESRILKILRETDVAGTIEAAECVHALMSTIVIQFQTLVDVHASCIVPR